MKYAEFNAFWFSVEVRKVKNTFIFDAVREGSVVWGDLSAFDGSSLCFLVSNNNLFFIITDDKRVLSDGGVPRQVILDLWLRLKETKEELKGGV